MGLYIIVIERLPSKEVSERRGITRRSVFINRRVKGNDTAIRRSSVRRRRSVLVLPKGEVDADQGRDSTSIRTSGKA